MFEFIGLLGPANILPQHLQFKHVVHVRFICYSDVSFENVDQFYSRLI